MILNVNERLQFQYLLPAQGNFKTLELVDSILQKLKITNLEETEKEFSFSPDEKNLIHDSFQALDQSSKLPYQSLSVLRKIKEELV
jgi:hypothetical protein